MVKITFNFLLGIPKSSEEVDGAENRGDGINMKNYTEYRVDKPGFLCHIEYVLAPEEQPKSVDVISWGKAAKIYVEEESAAIVPLALDKICWIYFRVKHVTAINNRGVNDFINHNIIVTVSTDGKKFSQGAKSEKVRVFYGIRSVDRRTVLFPPLWEDSTERPTDSNNNVLSTNMETSGLSSKLKGILLTLTEEYNRGVGKRSTIEREHPPWRDLRMQRNESDARIDKDEGSKSKGDLNTDLSFVISGESMLSGLKIIENHVKYNSEELPFLCCVAKIRDVLTPDETKTLNPFSVTLRRVKFVPSTALRREKIRKIRFRFVVCDRYEAESNDIEIDDNMILNYTRTIPTDRITTPELIEFIQTKGLKVKMMGIREDGVNGAEKVKSSVYKDQGINCKSGLPGTGMKIRPLGHSRTVLLGIANIDISPVLLQPHRLSVQYNFTCRHDPPDPSAFLATVNPAEVNTRVIPRCDNLCRILPSSPAVLNISVRLSFPILQKYDFLKPFVRSRNRIFIILHDVNTAVGILKRIQARHELLAPMDYSRSATPIGRPLSVYHELKEPGTPMLELTGFLIDCVDHFLFYIEGPSFGVLQDIWSIASLIEPSQGRVLYDSSLLFNDIFHQELIRYGGFYAISLRQSPAPLLRDHNTYKEGSIPKPAYKALIQLHQLTNCPSMTTAVQNNLFPDYNSLLSLDLEFGVPMRFSHVLL